MSPAANPQVLAHIQRLAAQLQSALQTRSVIDRAVGILMSRTGGTEGEAVARLRALSQNEQQLEVVAKHPQSCPGRERPRPLQP
jgi:AmiR/NasT family two-component response regulator